jgi:ABC-type multidrug transport system fused ATPase/permease subunit
MPAPSMHPMFSIKVRLHYGFLTWYRLRSELLETILFAQIRFHDTVSRGRLLNRFGKDFEGIDSNLADNFGRSTIHVLSAIIVLSTISYVGGLPFIVAILLLGVLFYQGLMIFSKIILN